MFLGKRKYLGNSNGMYWSYRHSATKPFNITKTEAKSTSGNPLDAISLNVGKKTVLYAYSKLFEGGKLDMQ